MPSPRHQVKRSRAVFKLQGLSLSIEQAFVLLVLDDMKHWRGVDADQVAAIWRHYMAANLVSREWLTRAFKRQPALQRGKSRLQELISNGLAWLDGSHPRASATAALLVAQLRGRFAPAMPAQEFKTYCENTYVSVRPVA